MKVIELINELKKIDSECIISVLDWSEDYQKPTDIKGSTGGTNPIWPLIISPSLQKKEKMESTIEAILRLKKDGKNPKQIISHLRSRCEEYNLSDGDLLNMIVVDIPIRQKYWTNFPKNVTCPICNTSKDEDYTLVPIHGTGDGRIAESHPIHVNCLWTSMNKVVYVKEKGVLFIEL